MRYISCILTLILTVLQPLSAAPTEMSQGDYDRLSEMLGYLIGKNLKQPGLEISHEKLIEGIQSAFAGKEPPMSEQEFEEKIAQMQATAVLKMANDNLEKANAFLKKNKMSPGVVELEPSKLQYKILDQGTGPIVSQSSTPEIEYKGELLDGTVFGNSDDTGAITLSLDQTIPGFSKGVLGMKEGETRRLFVHPDLGYGVSGHLPPNSLLIFEVKVIKSDNPNGLDNGE